MKILRLLRSESEVVRAHAAFDGADLIESLQAEGEVLEKIRDKLTKKEVRQTNAIAVMSTDRDTNERQIEELHTEVEALRALLHVAQCPDCGGSGAYYDSYTGEVFQCQWCDEKNQALPPSPDRGEEG